MFDLSLHILDIVQNSLQCGAGNITVCYTRQLTHTGKETLNIVFADDGSGMDEATKRKAVFTDYSSSGLKDRGRGLPLLQKAVQLAGGYQEVLSELGVGTVVTAAFNTQSPNMPPVGGIALTITTLLLSNTKASFVFNFDIHGKKVNISSKDILTQLFGGKLQLKYSDIAQLEDYISYLLEPLQL